MDMYLHIIYIYTIYTVYIYNWYVWVSNLGAPPKKKTLSKNSQIVDFQKNKNKYNIYIFKQ